MINDNTQTPPLTAVDCQSFAGGFAYGVVKSGFTLLAKREQAGAFGTAVMEGNRAVLGDGWTAEDGPADTWTPVNASLVFGNPPCSGFSRLTTTSRDQEWLDEQKSCMYDFANYAAKCRPLIAIFESVQAAYYDGRELMLHLRDLLEQGTGEQYTLYHVLHNVADLGGAQDRPRYFWVAARVPFGVTLTRRTAKTLRDAIGNLENVELGSVEGHQPLPTPRGARLRALAERGDWAQGERANVVGDRHPEVELDANDKRAKGSYTAVRLKYDATCKVIVGDAPERYVHPTQPRLLTLREVARITGFGDDWQVTPYTQPKSRSRWFGKGITVPAGTWIATMAREALLGQARPHQGTLIGDREYLIDNREDYVDA
jgi:DNA (cytosine-5)-methyltransferase 1